MAGTLDIIVGIAIISVFVGLIAAFMVSKYNAALKLKNKIKDEWSNLVLEVNYRFQLSTSYIQVVQTVVDVNLLNTLVALINRYNTLAAVQDIIDCYYQQEQLLMQINAYVLQSGLNVAEWTQAYNDNKTRIENLRVSYNNDQLAMNNIVSAFPTNMMAKAGGFTKGVYFRGE